MTTITASRDHLSRPLHPLVQGLLATLPALGEDWTADRRAKWLRAAAAIIDLIYLDDDAGRVEIEVAEREAQ